MSATQDLSIEALAGAAKQQPGSPGAQGRLAGALARAGRLPEALAACERAVALAAYAPELQLLRAQLLASLGRASESAAAYGRVAVLRPADPAAAFNHGLALQVAGRAEAALAEYDRTLALEPGEPGALSNKAVVLLGLNRPAEALAACDAAVAADPGFAAAHTNRGLALRELNRPQEAVEAFDRALSLAPAATEAVCNRAVCQLLLGDFEVGFTGHERRWDIEPLRSQQRRLGKPLWLGEGDIAGRRLLLHAEQGLGDTLQFARYARSAAERGAHVVMEAPAALIPVLRSLEGVETLIPAGEPLPEFDLHTPMMSLPLAFRTRLETIPAQPAYLSAPPERVAAWAERLGPRRAFRIGAVWFGKPTHTNDPNRSIPLAQFAQALPRGVEVISLHDRMREADAAALAAHPEIRRFDAEIADFGDTAALASLVDLVVSVDTSAAHLAGALGRPTWVLLPFAPDWRWLLEREDSPWYPSFRLFRQPALGDWATVLARLRSAIGDLAGSER